MANAHISAHAAEHSHVRDYIVIFLSLTCLTILEVAITFTALSPFMLTSILLILAFVKAFLVAWYFMHLKYDAKFLAVIAAVPAFLVCIAIAIIGYEWTHFHSTAPATNLKYILPGEHAAGEHNGETPNQEHGAGEKH